MYIYKQSILYVDGFLRLLNNVNSNNKTMKGKKIVQRLFKIHYHVKHNQKN